MAHSQAKSLSHLTQWRNFSSVRGIQVNVKCYGLCIILQWAFSWALDKAICFSELEKGLALVHLGSGVKYF
jgi:hypothetical protein